MNKLGINFIEKTICWLTSQQQGTEIVPDIDPDKLRRFIPAEFQTRTCLMWDFEAHTCTVCEDYFLSPGDKANGCIITNECFRERPDCTVSCNADLTDFLAELGYSQFSAKELLPKLPADLRWMLGLK